MKLVIFVYSNRLKKIRKEKNLTQQQIANAIKIDRGQFSHYEIEYDIFPLKHLNNVCNFLNVSFDYIFELTNENNFYYSENIDSKLVGKRLKDVRKSLGLTQNDIAKLLNLDQPVISIYENGKCLIGTAFLYTICSKYKISADYLLGRTDEPKYLK